MRGDDRKMFKASFLVSPSVISEKVPRRGGLGVWTGKSKRNDEHHSIPFSLIEARGWFTFLDTREYDREFTLHSWFILPVPRGS